MDSGTLQAPPGRGILQVAGGRAVCPVCGRRTKQRIGPDTRLVNFPLWCDRCRSESKVNYRVPEPESLSR